MKYIKQLLIIMIISFIGEFLNKIIPLPIPASVIMLVALFSGILKLEHIEETADFLLKIMPLMFIPAGVGLMNVWSSVNDNLLSIICIVFVSTCITMAVAGKTAQYFVKKHNRKRFIGKGE